MKPCQSNLSSRNLLAKLGLGSVQFGYNYGISNKGKSPSTIEIEKIMRKASAGGFSLIDTAPAYGNSEKVLGQVLTGIHPFNIITKTPVFETSPITRKEVTNLDETFYSSLSRLGQDQLYGLLVHNCENLFFKNGELLYHKMHQLKKDGLVEKIGVSIYTQEQLTKVLSNYSVDLVQVPINVLDQRLLNSGYLSDLKSRGIEIHARSAFLQGLLLMEPHDLPSFFNVAKVHLKRYHDFVKDNGLSPLAAALNFVLNIKEIDHVLVGVNRVEEIEDILSIKQAYLERSVDFSSFSFDNEEILNPSLWDY